MNETHIVAHARLAVGYLDARRTCFRTYPLYFIEQALLVGVLTGSLSVLSITCWLRDLSDADLLQLGMLPAPFPGDPLPRPSYDTLLRLTALLDPQLVPVVLGGEKFRHLAIDGKVLRGAKRPDGTYPLIVTLWDVDRHCVLSQVHGKLGDEETLARLLLHGLDLRGCVVTLDALHTSKKTAELIRTHKGHYLLCVKGNRAALKKELLLLSWGKPDVTHNELGHGRSETRRGSVLPAPEGLFPEAAWAGKLIRTRRLQGKGKDGKRTVFFLTSLPELDALQMMKLVREHWSIENDHHRPKDVLLGEDASRLKGRRAVVMSRIRSQVTDLLHSAGAHQLSRVLMWCHGRIDRALRLLRGEVGDEVRKWCQEGRKRT